VALLRNDKDWEAHVIESPTMVKQGDSYIMFFSANHFGWEDHQRLSPYAMGYAAARVRWGRAWTRRKTRSCTAITTVRRAASAVRAPGAVRGGGAPVHRVPRPCGAGGCRNANRGRYMYVAPLMWRDGVPRLGVSLRPVPAARAGERG
jgi:hypothetical protein